MHPPDPISSTKNPLVRRVRAVRDGDEPGLMVAEGVRLVEEVLQSPCEIAEAYVSDKLLHNERGRELRTALSAKAGKVVSCADQVLERASDVETHQGILCLVRRPVWSDADLLQRKPALLAVAAGVRDPGNLGALVRTAEAAGASGFVALRGSADPFKDKAVRGSAGSIFRLPCRANVTPDELKHLLAKGHIPLIAADRDKGTVFWDCKLAGAVAVVLGSEGAGIPEELRPLCQQFVQIPMAAHVESLNVAVAAGLLLYEARRQRERG